MLFVRSDKMGQEEISGSARLDKFENTELLMVHKSHQQDRVSQRGVRLTSLQCDSDRHRATAEPRAGVPLEASTVTPRSAALEPLQAARYVCLAFPKRQVSYFFLCRGKACSGQSWSGKGR